MPSTVIEAPTSGDDVSSSSTLPETFTDWAQLKHVSNREIVNRVMYLLTKLALC